MNSNDMSQSHTKKNLTSVFFIYILFAIFSVYNETNFFLRPTELFIPILALYFLSYIRQAKQILFVGLSLISYLLLVEIVNNGFSEFSYALERLRYWIYIVFFLVLAKIFSNLNLMSYKKSILNAMIISMSLILMIYILIYIDISFVKKYFSPFSIQEDMLILSGERLTGVSVSVVFLFIVLVYLLDFSKKIKVSIFAFALIILFFTLSRQNLVSIFALYAVLFFSYRLILFITFFVTMSMGVISQYLHILLNNDNFYTIGKRLAELVYITASPSLLGRLRDTGYFIDNWTKDFGNFILGHGLSFRLNYPRYYSEFDPFTGTLNVYYHIAYDQLRHNADNILSLLIVEGGLLLLVFVILILVYAGLKIYKNDKRLGLAFFLLCIITGVPSVHIITNYIIVFTLGFMYYYSSALEKNRTKRIEL